MDENFSNSAHNQQKEDGAESEPVSKINKNDRLLKGLAFKNPGKLFINEASGKRKPKSRSQYDIQNGERPIYDENGLLIHTGQDICDCLRNGCPGCHFPCKQCKSTKCGNKCRVNRNWYYEKIEIEGLGRTLEMELNS